MARRDGELSIREAARLLEVHEDTVRAWCRAAVASASPSLAGRLRGAVRRDAVGYYWVQKQRIEELADQVERGLGEYA